MGEKYIMNTLKIAGTILLLTSLAGGLAGCASSGSGSSVLPTGGATMSQIYNNQMNTGSSGNSQLNEARSKVPVADYWSEKASYTRPVSQVSGYSSVNQQSAGAPKMLPNPSMQIYVYPHFDGNDQDYIPAHTAYVKLYKQAHFALPGEAAE